MILRFKTKRNANGWRRYLAINTDNKTFTTESPHIFMDGEEISTAALRNIRAAAESDGYTETEAF